MARHDNYPDDMRQHDSNPQSPEFTGPDEEITIPLTDEEAEKEERESYNEYWKQMLDEGKTDLVITYDDDEDVTEPITYSGNIEDVGKG